MAQPTQPLVRLLGMPLIVLVLLVQAYLLFHETEHAVAGEHESCAVCQLAQHQDHGLIQHAPLIAAGTFAIPQHASAQLVILISEHYFAARAPPVAQFL